jgi:hypothetical protein
MNTAVAAAVVEERQRRSAAIPVTEEFKDERKEAGPLSPRSVPENRGGRFIGSNRTAPRMADVQRRFVDTGIIAPEVFVEFAQAMGMATEVTASSSSSSSSSSSASSSSSSSSPPSSAASLLRLLRKDPEAGGSAGGLFGLLQQEGITERDSTTPEALLNSLFQDFRTRSQLATKKQTTQLDSFDAFVKKIVDLKLLAPALADSDQASAYWTMDWIFKSMVFINTEHGWPVAKHYHTLVMEGITKGLIDIDAIIESPEVRAGHIGAALHQSSLLFALVANSSKPKNPKKTTPPGAGERTTTGTAKASATNTEWCDHHELYFPKSSKHSSSSCREKQRLKKG